MPIDDDDDEDSFHLAPPRLSEPLGDENHTQRSVELPRRAISELPGNRIGRESFGLIRLSDRFADVNELDPDSISEAADDDSIARQDFDDQDYDLDPSTSAPIDLFE